METFIEKMALMILHVGKIEGVVLGEVKVADIYQQQLLTHWW